MPSSPVFIGIDPAAATFTAAIYHPQRGIIATLDAFENDSEGFALFEHQLREHGCSPDSATICVEATGVYAEHLCYWLYSRHWNVALESPRELKKSFRARAKTDALDARQIAEYAWRYSDRLVRWHPNDAVVEQISVLLSTREQLTSQLTANRNALKAVERKYVDTPAARQIYSEMISYLKQRIGVIDAEITRLISEHPTLSAMVTILVSAPGVGMLMAANLIVMTRGFSRTMRYRHLASYVGICPYEHTSGSSVHRRARSCGFGPRRLRKLLYLAALSARQHHASFQEYYLRKLGQGKSGRLIINNIANKLLRILCSMINTKTEYNHGASRKSLPQDVPGLTLS